ncbi:MAG: DEAD/DEAH box helicase, partial [Thermoplasmata archaeon]|nr:DEAD/DEAH box helicase [Thermoplasmata archaeon]
MASDVRPPFDRLTPQLQGLLPALGISEPTEAQIAGVPKVLDGDHLVLIAPTGMGKTEAVTLPLLDILLRRMDGEGEDAQRGFQLLYIT